MPYELPNPLTPQLTHPFPIGRSRGRSGADSRYSQGYGVICKTDNNVDGTIKSADIAEAISYAYVDIVQCDFYWSILQPSNTGIDATDFDFSTVAAALATIKAAGKRMLFTLTTCGGGTEPSWYYTSTRDGTAIQVATSGGSTFPLIWDDVYKSRLLRLFNAIQKRFGTEPGIEGFRGCGFAAGTFEPSLYGSNTSDATMKSTLQSYGLVYQGSNPIYNAASPYTQVVDYLVRAFAAKLAYHANFVTIHFPGSASSRDYDLDTMMRATNEELKLVAVNNGLNENVAETSRTYFANTLAKGCWRTGWGGTTSITDTDAAWYEAMRRGFGGSFAEGDYATESNGSYFTVNATGSLPDHAAPVQYGRALLNRP